MIRVLREARGSQEIPARKPHRVRPGGTCLPLWSGPLTSSRSDAVLMRSRLLFCQHGRELKKHAAGERFQQRAFLQRSRYGIRVAVICRRKHAACR